MLDREGSKDRSSPPLAGAIFLVRKVTLANFFVPLALGLATFLATVAVFIHSPAFDDAFITATFARNLAHGHGFTWTAGDAAFLGPTSPAYALLLACAERIGVPAVVASLWIGPLGWSVARVLLFAVLRRARSVENAALAVLWSGVLAIGPRLSVGMETGLSVALVFAAIWLADRSAWRGAFIV